MSRLRILLSAYACEPDKGSEPGLGWDLVMGLAQVADVHVVTRANNRRPTEEALSRISRQHVPIFHYFDLPEACLRFKRLTRSHRWYYNVWQQRVQPLVRQVILENRLEVAHHATFASFRYSTAVCGHGVPVVWGPVGGAEQTPWNLLPWKYPVSLRYELLRNLSNTIFLSTARRQARHWNQYSAVLASTRETQSMFASAGIRAKLMPAIGLGEPSNVSRKSAPGALRLLFVGPLHYLKGVQFVIDALAGTEDICLTVVGSGPFESKLRELARRRHVQDKVRFTGQMPQAELKNMYVSHAVFVFPSLHDSGGMAVLEAMNSELPVICLDCGGPALSVSDRCGFKIPLGSRHSITLGIRNAIRQYQDDRSLVEKHGRAARERIKSDYTWPAKIDALLDIYRQVLEESRC
jgi:glycosyltransferase involved in cell wall biosynthesis